MYATPVQTSPSTSTEPSSLPSIICAGSDGMPNGATSTRGDHHRACTDHERMRVAEPVRAEYARRGVAGRGARPPRAQPADLRPCAAPTSSATPTKPSSTPGEPRAGHAVRAEAGQDQRREERRRRLQDPGEAGVEPRLGPGEEQERDRGVDERHHGQAAERPPKLVDGLPAERQQGGRHEHDRGEGDPQPDDERSARARARRP